jgi:carboxyl-terminal processing protease
LWSCRAPATISDAEAKILGTQSFGKGSVQTILPLSNNTAIKLTTARYFTPSGETIQAKGIKPDLWVEETEKGDVSDRLRVRESDLNRHLDETENKKNDANVSEKSSKRKSASQNNNTPQQEPIEFGSKEDYQLIQAMNHLRGLPVNTSKPISENVN